VVVVGESQLARHRALGSDPGQRPLEGRRSQWTIKTQVDSGWPAAYRAPEVIKLLVIDTSASSSQQA